MSVWEHTSGGRRGAWYLAISFPGRRREKFYLGRVTKAQAAYIDARVMEIHRSRPLAVPMSIETVTWLATLRGPLREWLERLQLVDAIAEPDRFTLGDWCDRYLESRTDYTKGTKKGWKTARKHMVSAFPEAKMHQITAFDAHQFARDLAKRASSEHASKIVERVKQLFDAAIQAKLLTENPFSGVKITAKRDKSRDFYLDVATSEAVLKACANKHAAAIFALARWCGLRVPHEPLALKWEHIDLEQLRIRVPADTKTGFRVLPLFSRAVEPVRALRAITPLDQEYVFDRARRSAATTWRDWLLDAIAAAGLHGWPKVWHNLRASCRTDLEDVFESHVCDAWLGHSHRVAKDHYLMVTPEDWQKAMGV